MDCACVYIDDCDQPSFYESYKPKARKQHSCCECGRTIEKGEVYEVVTGMWDGNIGRYKTCLDCVSVREAMFCGGWLHYSMWEDVGNHVFECDGEIGSSSLQEMTTRGRDMVCKLIHERWEDLDD